MSPELPDGGGRVSPESLVLRIPLASQRGGQLAEAGAGCEQTAGCLLCFVRFKKNHFRPRRQQQLRPTHWGAVCRLSSARERVPNGGRAARAHGPGNHTQNKAALMASCGGRSRPAAGTLPSPGVAGWGWPRGCRPQGGTKPHPCSGCLLAQCLLSTIASQAEGTRGPGWGRTSSARALWFLGLLLCLKSFKASRTCREEGWESCRGRSRSKMLQGDVERAARFHHRLQTRVL